MRIIKVGCFNFIKKNKSEMALHYSISDSQGSNVAAFILVGKHNVICFNRVGLGYVFTV